MAGFGWPRIKSIVLQAVGYTFLVLGVLGMFLPILQGFLFLFIGLIILARQAPWAKRLLENLRARHARIDRLIVVSEAKVHEWSETAEARWRFWRHEAGLWLRRRGLWDLWRRAARQRCPCRPDP